MSAQFRIDSLGIPAGKPDVVLDTDTYNEIDDQFAVAYLLSYAHRLNILGFCAAPFHNPKSSSPEDGMNKSYDELTRILRLAGREDLVAHTYRGSTRWFADERDCVPSEAARFLAEQAAAHDPGHPLYIVAIGAITNVASALRMNPSAKENIVVVWLGGHAHHMPDTKEFNMKQDIAAARVLFDSGVPLVQLPCAGVVDRFATTRYELEAWLKGRNALCDYLVENTIREAESYAAGKPWSRVIWDVTAVAWLVNDGDRFMTSELRPSPIPQYDGRYSFDARRHPIRYVTSINRDALFEDLFTRLKGE